MVGDFSRPHPASARAIRIIKGVQRVVCATAFNLQFILYSFLFLLFVACYSGVLKVEHVTTQIQHESRYGRDTRTHWDAEQFLARRKHAFNFRIPIGRIWSARIFEDKDKDKDKTCEASRKRRLGPKARPLEQQAFVM